MPFREEATRHPDSDRLFAYFEEKLPEGDEGLIEEHLADCPSCARLAREVHSFHSTWEDWTPQRLCAAQAQARVATALAEASAQPQSAALAERLRNWRDRFRGAAEAGLRVVLDVGREQGRALAEGVAELTRPGGAWQFTPMPVAQPVRGVAAAAHESLMVTASSAGGPSAHVAVHAGAEGEVTVRVDDVASLRHMPLVVLLGTGLGDSFVRVVAAEREEGTSYAVARFRSLPGGEYLVAIEPLPS